MTKAQIERKSEEAAHMVVQSYLKSFKTPFPSNARTFRQQADEFLTSWTYHQLTLNDPANWPKEGTM